MLVRVMIRGGSFHGLFSMSGPYDRSPNSSIPPGFFFPEWKTEERRDRENFFSFPSIFFLSIKVAY